MLWCAITSTGPFKIVFTLFSDTDDCDPYPCVNNATCIDGVNNYTCACHPGFEGRNCNISKLPIKEFFFFGFYYAHILLQKIEVTKKQITLNNYDTYGRILVYIFCLISIGLSLSDEANKMKFLITERA